MPRNFVALVRASYQSSASCARGDRRRQLSAAVAGNSTGRLLPGRPAHALGGKTGRQGAKSSRGLGRSIPVFFQRSIEEGGSTDQIRKTSGTSVPTYCNDVEGTARDRTPSDMRSTMSLPMPPLCLGHLAPQEITLRCAASKRAVETLEDFETASRHVVTQINHDIVVSE